MHRLREKPLRLERHLTREYINQAVKMAEIEARMNQTPFRRWWWYLTGW